jgi:hypothetical protein
MKHGTDQLIALMMVITNADSHSLKHVQALFVTEIVMEAEILNALHMIKTPHLVIKLKNLDSEKCYCYFIETMYPSALSIPYRGAWRG